MTIIRTKDIGISKLSKSQLLKKELNSKELSFLMEAHNGLTAKIVEANGFKGIWASGLSISTALGVRDSNEASWTQILDVLEFMSDATTIPILVDGDTGYGNFNNFRRLVSKLCQRKIAGVCIEDKQYPKSDKFIISLFVNESFFQKYENITIKYKKNDNNFIIHNISGGIYYNDNFNNCLNKMTEVEKDLSIFFNTAEKRKGSKKHSYDKSGKSIIHAIEYDLESGGTIQIKCTDWSEAINMIDNLSISVTTDEFVNFILTEAY